MATKETYAEKIKRIESFSDLEVEDVWVAIGEVGYIDDEDWLELVYSEMGRRGIPAIRRDNSEKRSYFTRI